MFDQTFVDVPRTGRKSWTMALSFAVQCGVVAVLLLVPLLHPELLHLKIEVPIFIPLRPLTEAAPTPARATQQVAGPSRPVSSHIFTAPSKVPDRISMVADAPPDAGMNVGPIAAGPVSAIGVPAPLPAYVAPPPQAATARQPEPPRGPVHVSSGIQSARLLFGPKPPYPSLARAARVQGNVRIEAVIAKDGSIQNLSTRGGPPLLVNAAIDAVRQWRYRPTLLNGEPVEVITEIDVNFTLNQ